MQLVHPPCAACTVARGEHLLRIVQTLLLDGSSRDSRQLCGAGRCEVRGAPSSPELLSLCSRRRTGEGLAGAGLAGTVLV